MDPDTDVLYGPHPVQKKTGSVTIPRALLSEIGVEPGQSVHWALNPNLPGTLLLIPSKMLHRAMPDVIEALREASS